MPRIAAKSSELEGSALERALRHEAYGGLAPRAIRMKVGADARLPYLRFLSVLLFFTTSLS